jgi:hypothetical protein
VPDIHIQVHEISCTYPCTLRHEKKHVEQYKNPNNPIAKCCKKYQKKWSAADDKDSRMRLMLIFGDWIKANQPLIECPAVEVSLTCLTEFSDCIRSRFKGCKSLFGEIPERYKDGDQLKDVQACSEDIVKETRKQLDLHSTTYRCAETSKRKWTACPFE